MVDNEGMGKKSSKVCCIYHKAHDAGEGEPGDSGEESDSDSSDGESGDERDLSRAQPAGGKGKGKERNAYERQPKYRSKREG